MKDILRLVVVLGAICTVAGAALAAVYDFTKKPIELQLLQNVQGPAIEAVLEGFKDQDYDPIKDNFKIPAGKDKKGRDVEKTIFPAKKGGALTAVALSGVGKGFDGEISVMVGINPADSKLTGISIMEQSETPGIGTRVTESSFTGQFKGKELDNPTAVDGVSGATYSTKGVYAAVESAVKFFEDNKQEILSKAK